MKLYDLLTLHLHAPVIDQTPEFSWKIDSDKRNVLQKSYQIIVRKSAEGDAGNAIVWDSGVVNSRQQSFIPYQGEALLSKTRYTWSVTVWDNCGEQASACTIFETALLKASDWNAKWIECPFERKAANEYKFGNAYPAVEFTKQFTLANPVKYARLYATCHGVYQIRINGKRPDARELAPEFTPYP